MYNFIEDLKNELNFTTTENGAGALRSTKSALLDAFGSLGAMRFAPDTQVIDTFAKAFREDPAMAMRLLFYIRDIRGGQGARNTFRVIAKWLAYNHPDYVVNNLDNFLFFGRGDDVLCLLDTPIKNQVIKWLFSVLMSDVAKMRVGEPCSLLAKWMPSENTSSRKTKELARTLIKKWGVSASWYRHTLVKLRKYIKVVEQKMSARNWTEINYESVPAKAAMRYSGAFEKHDREGYYKYLMDVVAGDKKINAASLFPVDIVHRARHLPSNAPTREKVVLDAMWEALPNYLEGKEETGICVVDTSGSMCGTPIEVAISLGMYCADKCRGPFKGHFITFSNRPELIEIKGDHIVEKVKNISNANWNMNTNLEAVFDLLLTTAKRNRTRKEDMPQKLYIISDMQFDEARGADGGYYWHSNFTPRTTFMATMRDKYAMAGYDMPTIVYWNVRASKCGMFQDTFEGQNCCMVSGYSASLFKSIIEGTTYEEEVVIDKVTGEKKVVTKATVDPITVMMTTLMNERYDRVWVGLRS